MDFGCFIFLIEQALIQFGDSIYRGITRIGCMLGSLVSILVDFIRKTVIIQLNSSEVRIKELGKSEQKYVFKDTLFSQNRIGLVCQVSQFI